jgi:hypothetical protein
MQLRIRTVKPEFFKHEKLFDLEKETGLPIRLAWVGLFAIADREGRFNWRSRTIKAEILPYDTEIEFARVLDTLAAAGMIVKYEVDGETYGHIPTFKKHQVVNAREAQSKLPEPPVHMRAHALHVQARVEGKGREGKGTEGGESPTPPPAGTHILGPVLKELAGNSRREQVLSRIPLDTQGEWLETYDLKWLKDSILHAIQNYAKEDPVDCVKDWPAKLARWFKIEKKPKFKTKAVTNRPREPMGQHSLTPLSEIINKNPDLAMKLTATGVRLKTC